MSSFPNLAPVCCFMYSSNYCFLTCIQISQGYLRRTNIQKRCPFHYRRLECKSRKSRDTWSNRQIGPWGTKQSRSKANRVLPREHTGHSKHPLPTTQEKTLHMDITRWSILKSDWLIFFAAKVGKALHSLQKQEQVLTVAQIMNSWLPNSDLNWRKEGKPLDIYVIQVWLKSNPILYIGSDK